MAKKKRTKRDSKELKARKNAIDCWIAEIERLPNNSALPNFSENINDEDIQKLSAFLSENINVEKVKRDCFIMCLIELSKHFDDKWYEASAKLNKAINDRQKIGEYVTYEVIRDNICPQYYTNEMIESAQAHASIMQDIIDSVVEYQIGAELISNGASLVARYIAEDEKSGKLPKGYKKALFDYTSHALKKNNYKPELASAISYAAHHAAYLIMNHVFPGFGDKNTTSKQAFCAEVLAFGIAENFAQDLKMFNAQRQSEKENEKTPTPNRVDRNPEKPTNLKREKINISYNSNAIISKIQNIANSTAVKSDDAKMMLHAIHIAEQDLNELIKIYPTKADQIQEVADMLFSPANFEAIGKLCSIKSVMGRSQGKNPQLKKLLSSEIGSLIAASLAEDPHTLTLLAPALEKDFHFQEFKAHFQRISRENGDFLKLAYRPLDNQVQLQEHMSKKAGDGKSFMDKLHSLSQNIEAALGPLSPELDDPVTMQPTSLQR